MAAEQINKIRERRALRPAKNAKKNKGEAADETSLFLSSSLSVESTSLCLQDPELSIRRHKQNLSERTAALDGLPSASFVPDFGDRVECHRFRTNILSSHERITSVFNHGYPLSKAMIVIRVDTLDC